MTMPGAKPEWLTFDCYGTLIQWDEGLLAVAGEILSTQTRRRADARTLLDV